MQSERIMIKYLDFKDFKDLKEHAGTLQRIMKGLFCNIIDRRSV